MTEQKIIYLSTQIQSLPLVQIAIEGAETMQWGSFIVGFYHNQIDQVQRCPATQQDQKGLY